MTDRLTSEDLVRIARCVEDSISDTILDENRKREYVRILERMSDIVAIDEGLYIYDEAIKRKPLKKFMVRLVVRVGDDLIADQVFFRYTIEECEKYIEHVVFDKDYYELHKRALKDYYQHYFVTCTIHEPVDMLPVEQHRSYINHIGHGLYDFQSIQDTFILKGINLDKLKPIWKQTYDVH